MAGPQNFPIAGCEEDPSSVFQATKKAASHADNIANMPKRQRTGKYASYAKFSDYRGKLYGVLGVARGHLRQWQSKQIRESKKKDSKKTRLRKGGNEIQRKKDTQRVKQARLEKEVLVLKVRRKHLSKNEP